MVLDRLSSEESSLIDQATETLRSKFRIDPKRSYVFHSENLSVVETAVTTEGKSVEIPHLSFATSGEADAFVSLVTEKKEAANRLAMLRSLREAKEKKCVACDEFLRNAFHADPSASYRFDEDTRILWKAVSSKEWERIRAQEKAKAEAERKAAVAAREKARADAKAKAEAERRARMSAEERARADAKAKAEAERRARMSVEERARAEAEAKAKAEAEKARAAAEERKSSERRERAEAEAKAKAEAEQARAIAIRAEEEALAAHVAEISGERSRRRDEVARRKTAAEAGADRAAKTLADVENRLFSLREEGRLTELQRERLTAQIASAKAAYVEAEAAVKQAAKDLAAAEKALSSAESDARKAFYAKLRDQGRKPLTEPRGFFSWF